MKNQRRFLFVFFAGLTLLAAAACGPSAQAQLEGILQNVDSVSGEVTVRLKDGGTITINLQDVNVETLRQALGSPSLEPGSPVTVEVDQNNKPKKLKVRAAEAEGVIKGLDEAKKTVTISLEEGGEITVGVTEATKIEVEDEDDATFAALREGQEVEAKYDVETLKALKIEVEEGGEAKGEVKGVITAIGTPATTTVTIRAKDGTEASYKVTPATELKLDGVGTFAELEAGMTVEAKFNRATRALIKLEVED